MTAPIVVQAVRFGFLVLLWLFVFAALRVIRSDVFGTTRTKPAPPAPRATRVPTGTAAAPKRKSRRTAHQLVVTAGALTGTTIALSDRPISIGRASDSTLVLTDDYASSRHARLSQRDGDWYVEDLGSTNGTYLDRTKVTHPVLIPVGTPIRIGKTAMELRA